MDHETVDVLVIGAGAAGLSAARALAAEGFEVSILEGRDRIGGRIHTLHTSAMPIPVELGAEFVHGRPAEISDIVRHKMFPMAETTGDNFCRDAARPRLEKCNDFWSQWEYVSGKMRVENGRDESFLSFIDRLTARENLREDVRKHAIEYVEGFNAADASEISLQALTEDRDAAAKIEGGRPFHLIQGYDGIVERLASGLSIRRWTVVQEIQWQPGNVRVLAVHAVTGDLVQFEAKALIVTLPISILASIGERASVRFVPEIPKKIAAARSLKMGNVVKAILCFDEPFWANRGYDRLAFLHAQDQPFPVFWTTAPLITPVLTGWAGGPAADALAGLSQQHILSTALKSLAVCFGLPMEQLREHLVRSFVADWSSDPFSLGAYSHASAGQNEARKLVAAPIEKTLFFAGEATNTEGFSGTVHGAIATGNRAAREVIQSLTASQRIA